MHDAAGIVPAVNTQRLHQSKRRRFGMEYLAVRPWLYSNQDHGRVIVFYCIVTLLVFFDKSYGEK